jgi:glycosyltransferase involved in cell wall biosynthesis
MSAAPQADVEADPLPADVGVVYFGNEWFAENRTSSHHIARRLCRRAPLLYVDSPGMRPPSASGRDVRRLVRKLWQTVQPPRRVDPGLWHCTIPSLPWQRFAPIAWLNRTFGAWALRRAMRRAGIRRAILWFVVPHPEFLADRVPHELLVYYCIDDYAAHPGVDRERISGCDARLARRAHHVFVAPPALVAAKQAQNAAVTFAPHGVDVDLFARAQDPALPMPDLARRLPAPVIGYFGLIAAWTDVELIEWLARQRPEWQFLLVGHASVDVSALAALPNVAMAGPQPYESLPGWARAFRVAIIPYRDNQQVRNANPLKLREYLATGKPVVSAPTPEVERFREHVYLARDRGEWLRAIETAMAEDDAPRMAARMRAVAGMSWDRRIDETFAIVRAAFARRAQGGNQ